MRRAKILFHDSLHHSQTIKPNKYTSLVQLCLQQCKLIKTQKLFDEMPQRVSRSSKISKLVHSQSLILGFWSKGYLGNAILDLYAKCGNVGYVEKVFWGLEVRDILAWNSLLSMYLKQGCLSIVLRIFGLLWNSGVVANEFSFAIILSGCAKLKVDECGRQVHCNIIKMGFVSSPFCEGALIDMYAKCSCMTDARRVFDGAVDLDNVSWTAMINGYVQAGLPEEALRLVEEMKIGRELDEVASLTIINAFSVLGRLHDATKLFSKIHNPNVVAWNMMISGHSKRGFDIEAIEFYRNMRKKGIKPTRSTFGSVLSAIASVAAIDFGMLVHAEAIKLGLHSNVYVGSSVISMYTKCEKVEAAKKVFDALDEQNTVLWNAMLGGYAQNGYTYEVIELFSDMERCEIFHDEFTYTSVLSACANLEYVEVGRQLHSLIIKKRLASNLFAGNALVDMYAKSGVLKDARKQFELIKNKDNVSWNAIIVGYVQEEDVVEAFLMFRRMNLLGVLPDEVSLASVLSACANIKCLHRGTQVHCLSVKFGLDRSLYAGSALVDMYAKSGDINSCIHVFCAMHQRNVASFNALISGYVFVDFEKSVALLKEMRPEGLKPTEITLSSLLDACHGPQRLNIGKQLHCVVLKMGIRHDDDFLGVSLLSMYMNSLSKTDGVMLFSEFSNSKSTILWTSMICGLIQNDSSEEALQYYSEMRSCGVLPDQATFVSILKACAVISSVKDGRKIHSLIFQTGYDLDELTCSALVDMYSKCGDVGSSKQAFREMGSKNDVISWNSMIVGYAKNGYAIDALRVFDEMMQTDVRPDDITFLGVLTACSHAGRVSEGRRIFDTMFNFYNITPRADHCACMVDLLGRWGCLKEAEEFIDKLDFDPGPMIWATMLGACRIHGDEIRGQKAAERLIKAEPQNSASYVLLSNIYAASGNWDEVNNLRRAMRERGVKKLPGCSWIEVGRKTNMFVAGDKCHPNTSEIESVLKILTVLMKKDIYVTELDSFYHEIE